MVWDGYQLMLHRGYYYDVYTLMNMVATPQGEQSDTNIEKGHQDSQSVDDGQNGGMIK